MGLEEYFKRRGLNMGVHGSPDLIPNQEPPRKKKPFYKKWWFIIIIAIMVIGIIGGGGDEEEEQKVGNEIKQTTSETTTNKKTEDKKLSKEEKEKIKEEQALKEKEEFIELAKEYDYGEIERNPDEYKGKAAVFKGKVVQVSEGLLDTVVYRVATKDETNNVIYVAYKRPDGETRVLEDDIVTIYGELNGVTTYKSVLGGDITIPSIRAKYISIE